MTGTREDGRPVPATLGPRRLAAASSRQVRPPRLGPYGNLALLAAIWGNSFLLIKIGDASLRPVELTAGRVTAAASALGLTVWLRHDKLPRGRRVWGHLFVAGAIQNSLPFTLFAIGEQSTASAVAAICNATTALSTVGVSFFLLPTERASRRAITGLAIGFVGVAVVLGVWQGLGGAAGKGTVICLIAATSYGIGTPYTRRYLSGRGETVLALTAAQLACATAQMLGVVVLSGRTPHGVTGRSVAATLTLGLVGTAFAVVVNNGVIRSAGAAAASTVTYLVPFVATVSGIALLGEHLKWYQPVGALFILLGVAVARRTPRPPPVPEAEPAVLSGNVRLVLPRAAP